MNRSLRKLFVSIAVLLLALIGQAPHAGFGFTVNNQDTGGTSGGGCSYCDQDARGNGASERSESRADGSFLVRKRSGEGLELTLATGADSLEARQAVLAPDFAEPVVRMIVPSTRLSGRAVRGDEPLALVPVQIFAADGSLAAWGQTRADGSFTAEALRPGPYRLTVAGRPAGNFVLSEPGAVDLGTLKIGAGAP